MVVVAWAPEACQGHINVLQMATIKEEELREASGQGCTKPAVTWLQFTPGTSATMAEASTQESCKKKKKKFLQKRNQESHFSLRASGQFGAPAYISCFGLDGSEEDSTPEDFLIKIPQSFVTGPGECAAPTARASNEGEQWRGRWLPVHARVSVNCHGAFLPAALQPDSVPRRRRPAAWHRSSRTGENVRRGSGGEEPALWFESQTGNWARSSLAPRQQQPSWIGKRPGTAAGRAVAPTAVPVPRVQTE